MKIINTAILLGITLIVVPIVTCFFGTPPDPVGWKALHTLMIITAIAVGYTFLVGEITSNNSQVDKFWSLLPIAYAWIVAGYGDFHPRLVLMSLLVTLWGIRLTWNFSLKGAYHWRFWEGEEDYRWKVLRQKPEFSPRWKWSLFNLAFISGYQNILILLFTLPMVVALQYNTTPLNAFDYIAAFLMLCFIVLETVADIQQRKYQNGKKAFLQNKGEDPIGNFHKGFIDNGLWAFSRHPNYFSEQAIWVCFYLFGIAAGAPWFNWSIAGCLLLIVLFQGSSAFSEEISAGKYPGYKAYQESVSRFIPLPRRKTS
ncbi:MAG TPA: DUF1295 domain-containing protein [Bacteroidales bacterium]|nr:DUF1295 domain-containing protein [Bacteroidales bacterium]